MLIPSEGQELAIKFALEKKYSIIAMPPGQGKTLVGVEVAKRKKLNVLVICPSYGRKVWIDCFKQQIPDIQITNFKTGKDIYPMWDDGVAILSYSLLVDRKGEDRSKRADPLFEWADLVIFDECHYLKETDTKVSEIAHKLVYENRVPYLMLLSGTPAKNRIHELYSPIALCQYKHDESDFLNRFPTWVHFANRYSDKEYIVIKTRRGNIPSVKYKGIKNLEELKPVLDECYFKLPEKFLHKLPGKITYNIEADRLKNGEELYEAFEEFSINETGVSPDIKAKAALSTAKFTGLLVRDLLGKYESVVIFSDHVEPCNQIAENLSRFIGEKVEPIHGQVSLDKRKRILEDFQDGITKVIVATIGTLSTSISLVRSNVMVFNDFPWVSGDLEQAEKRIRRRGQEETCYYYYVMATKQSDRILKTVRAKRKDLKKIDKLMED